METFDDSVPEIYRLHFKDAMKFIRRFTLENIIRKTKYSRKIYNKLV